MDLNKKYRSDLKKEVEGVPVDFGDGAEVTVAYWGNERFLRRLEALMKPVQFQADQGTLPREKNKEIMDRVISETIVTHWKGIKIDGQEVPHSPEKVFEIIQKPEYHTFREALVVAAKEADAYRQEQVEAKAKN